MMPNMDVFDTIDRDHKGSITREEFINAFAGPQASVPPAPPRVAFGTPGTPPTPPASVPPQALSGPAANAYATIMPGPPPTPPALAPPGPATNAHATMVPGPPPTPPGAASGPAGVPPQATMTQQQAMMAQALAAAGGLVTFDAADKNKDGRVSREEFIDAILSAQRNRAAGFEVPEFKEANLEAQRKRAEVEQASSACDNCGTEYLADEAFCRKCGKPRLHFMHHITVREPLVSSLPQPKTLADLYREFDFDQDGKISKDEFKKGMGCLSDGPPFAPVGSLVYGDLIAGDPLPAGAAEAMAAQCHSAAAVHAATVSAGGDAYGGGPGGAGSGAGSGCGSWTNPHTGLGGGFGAGGAAGWHAAGGDRNPFGGMDTNMAGLLSGKSGRGAGGPGGSGGSGVLGATDKDPSLQRVPLRKPTYPGGKQFYGDIPANRAVFAPSEICATEEPECALAPTPQIPVKKWYDTRIYVPEERSAMKEGGQFFERFVQGQDGTWLDVPKARRMAKHIEECQARMDREEAEKAAILSGAAYSSVGNDDGSGTDAYAQGGYGAFGTHYGGSGEFGEHLAGGGGSGPKPLHSPYYDPYSGERLISYRGELMPKLELFAEHGLAEPNQGGKLDFDNLRVPWPFGRPYRNKAVSMHAINWFDRQNPYIPSDESYKMLELSSIYVDEHHYSKWQPHDMIGYRYPDVVEAT